MKFKKKIKVDRVEFEDMKKSISNLTSKLNRIEENLNIERLINYYDTNKLYKIKVQENPYSYTYNYFISNIYMRYKNGKFTFLFGDNTYELDCEIIKTDEDSFVKIRNIIEVKTNEI